MCHDTATDITGMITKDQDINSPDILTMAQANKVRDYLLSIGTGVKLHELGVMEIASGLSTYCDIGCKVEAPVAPDVEAPTRAQQGLGPVEEVKVDWDVYYGFKPAPPKSRVQYMAKIDPYTGLIKKT